MLFGPYKPNTARCDRPRVGWYRPRVLVAVLPPPAADAGEHAAMKERRAGTLMQTLIGFPRGLPGRQTRCSRVEMAGPDIRRNLQGAGGQAEI